jgi:putative hydrolase of the HAD superfamily
MRAMALGAVRAICFDLDNTLWDIEPVLKRAERILTDWLTGRYPRIAERFPPETMQELRATVLRELPQHAHDLSFVRRETIARMAVAAGYKRDIADEAFRPLACRAQPARTLRRSDPGARGAQAALPPGDLEQWQCRSLVHRARAPF